MTKEAIKIGMGEICKKCGELMERRKRIKPPKNGKTYFYTEWDYCKPCGHMQHYQKYKSGVWQEAEAQRSFFKDL